MREAPILRHHPAFHPDGTNVNFASIDGGAIRVRTFERGVEGETLACGTGAAAVAYAAIAVHCCESPVQVIFPGGNIEIHSGSGALRMIGKAQLVFRGEFPLF
jgi:diaminopimelate epimerase